MPKYSNGTLDFDTLRNLHLISLIDLHNVILH